MNNYIKRTIVFFIVSILYLNIFAQDIEKDANANFKNLYFKLALDQYLKLYEQDPNNIEYNFRIGYCYLNLEVDRSKSLSYLKFAKNNGYSDDALDLYIGMAYYYNYQFDKAKELLNSFISANSKDKENIKIAYEFQRYNENARNLTSKPLKVSFINLGDGVNSKFGDYNPYFNPVDNILFFTTDRRFNSMYKTYVKNVYYTSFDGKEWLNCKSVGSKINTGEDEILVGIAENNKSIFVQLKRFDVYNDIYSVILDENKLKQVLPLGDNINTKDIESGAALSASGDLMVFASDRPGGFGGLDLYYALKLPDGSYGMAHNLGSDINTPYDDNYPFLWDDGNRLYFASKGYNSMGGYDIFLANKVKNEIAWTGPKNLGYPINTIYDDNTISFTLDKRYAYKADIRKEGFGGYDIYQIVLKEEDPLYTIFKGKVQISNSDSNYSVNYYKKNLKLLVTDVQDGSLIGKFAISNTSGEYVLALPPGNFSVSINDGKFSEQKVNFIIPEMNSNRLIIRRNISFKQ